MHSKPASPLAELADEDLRHVLGSGLGHHSPPARPSVSGGEIQVSVSGPPMRAEGGITFHGPQGSLGGSFSAGAHDFSVQVGAARTWGSGNTTARISLGHDGQEMTVSGSITHRW